MLKLAGEEAGSSLFLAHCMPCFARQEDRGPGAHQPPQHPGGGRQLWGGRAAGPGGGRVRPGCPGAGGAATGGPGHPGGQPGRSQGGGGEGVPVCAGRRQVKQGRAWK